MIQVKDILEKDPGRFYSVSKTQAVTEAIQQMSGREVSALVVMDPDTESVEGIFTERDLVRCHLLFPDRAMDDIPVEDVMVTKLIVAEPSDTVDDAMAMMIQAKIRHLPVVRDKKIVSLLALEDLVKSHVGALTRELHYLKDYISDLQDAAHD
ncbi:MAG: CBS domain-containing protein [Desulfobacterales bacterium]|nr:CBS domain-containing protein [Desulfobacterales bacterium]